MSEKSEAITEINRLANEWRKALQRFAATSPEGVEYEFAIPEPVQIPTDVIAFIRTESGVFPVVIAGFSSHYLAVAAARSLMAGPNPDCEKALFVKVP